MPIIGEYFVKPAPEQSSVDEAVKKNEQKKDDMLNFENLGKMMDIPNNDNINIEQKEEIKTEQPKEEIKENTINKKEEIQKEEDDDFDFVEVEENTQPNQNNTNTNNSANNDEEGE